MAIGKHDNNDITFCLFNTENNTNEQLTINASWLRTFTTAEECLLAQQAAIAIIINTHRRQTGNVTYLAKYPVFEQTKAIQYKIDENDNNEVIDLEPAINANDDINNATGCCSNVGCCVIF